MSEPRYKRVGDFLIAEIEKAKPSNSPQEYPVLDPYLTGFEKGLRRAQHIIRVSARSAMTHAGRQDA